MLIIQPGTPSGATRLVGMVFAASLFAVVCGLASVFLPAWFVVSVLMMPALLVLALVRPEYGLLACIALACNLVHPALVPRVPFLGGSLAAADATLALLVVYAACSFAAQAGTHRSMPVKGGRLLMTSAALFGLSLIVAVVLSLTLWQLKPAVVLGEARDLSFLALLPVAIVILRQPQRHKRFIVGFVVLGCLFSIGQILQGIFGLPVFGTSGISALETLGYREYSTTRSNTHGLSVIIFSLFLTIGQYVLGSLRPALFMPLSALLLMGIFLTFGRTTFATVALCVIIVVAWLNLKKLPRLLGWLGAFLVVLSALAFFFKPVTFEAVLYRMTSIQAEIDYGYSAGWRFMEADAMLPHIQQYPFTGIGLGADYKGVSGSSAQTELNRYVHNGYLYMAGKMGVPALALFLLMMATIFAMGRRLAKSDATPAVRMVGAASAAMMVRYVLASITEPHLMSDHGVINIAVAGALVYIGAQHAAAAATKPAA